METVFVSKIHVSIATIEEKFFSYSDYDLPVQVDVDVDVEVCVTVAVPPLPCTVETETEVTVVAATLLAAEMVETLVTVTCPADEPLRVTVLVHVD